MYVADMTDHLAILRDRIEKADARAQRYRKSLKTAENELSDLTTALRVLEGIASGTDSNGPGTATTMGRQLEIVRLLGVGRENQKSPADLYGAYYHSSPEDITIDTFRTTLWRMKDRVFEVKEAEWVVRGDNGTYWKEEAEAPEPEYDRDGGWVAPTPHSSDDWDLDDPLF